MDQASTLFLAVSIMIIMVGMGLGLTLQDFKRVADHPKPVLIGLFNQIILLPLVGFGLCLVFKPEPFIAIGLMMLVACPGGTSSNIITLLAKGDLPLSISLTAINSLITIFTIPLIINFSFAYFNSEVGSIPPPAKDIFISLEQGLCVAGVLLAAAILVKILVDVPVQIIVDVNRFELCRVVFTDAGLQWNGLGIPSWIEEQGNRITVIAW